MAKENTCNPTKEIAIINRLADVYFMFVFVSMHIYTYILIHPIHIYLLLENRGCVLSALLNYEWKVSFKQQN